MLFLNLKKVLAAIVRSKETKALSDAKLIKQSKYEIASPSARNDSTGMSLRRTKRRSNPKRRDRFAKSMTVETL